MRLASGVGHPDESPKLVLPGSNPGRGTNKREAYETDMAGL